MYRKRRYDIKIGVKRVLSKRRRENVTQIDLVVSDSLQGIENAVCAAFPQAAHQFCVAHIKDKYKLPLFMWFLCQRECPWTM